MYVVYAFLYIYAYIIYVNIIWIEIWAGNLNSHRIPCILYETSLFIHLFWWIPRKPQLLPLDIPTPQVERLLFPVGHVCAWGRGGKKIRGLHCLNINCFARFFGFNSWDGILLPFPVLLNIKKKQPKHHPPRLGGPKFHKLQTFEVGAGSRPGEKLSHEKNLYYFPLYCLVNRDPYNG